MLQTTHFRLYSVQNMFGSSFGCLGALCSKTRPDRLVDLKHFLMQLHQQSNLTRLRFTTLYGHNFLTNTGFKNLMRYAMVLYLLSCCPKTGLFPKLYWIRKYFHKWWLSKSVNHLPNYDTVCEAAPGFAWVC